jgi:hypothetical protein
MSALPAVCFRLAAFVSCPSGGLFLRGRMVGVPRFTLKDLLAGMGLIAVGLSLILVSLGPIFEQSGGWAAALPIGFWYLGAACIGGRALAPFKMARVGAWIALISACIYDLRF